MSVTNEFKVTLKAPVCIDGLSEDAIRDLVDNLGVSFADGEFTSFVFSSGGTQVKFVFDPSGNFYGVTAKIGGKDIMLIGGAGSSTLGIFKGAPNNTNPGAGWEVEEDLTRQYLNQPPNRNDWSIFYASRVSVINNL